MSSEHYSSKEQREEMFFRSAVYHDIDNLASFIKNPNIDDSKKQRLIDDKFIPNLIKGRDRNLLEKELFLNYIEDENPDRQEVV